jgi:hypothetical protein
MGGGEDDIWFGNIGEKSPIIIYSMTEMSACLGNEEEDGEEGEDE